MPNAFASMLCLHKLSFLFWLIAVSSLCNSLFLKSMQSKIDHSRLNNLISSQRLRVHQYEDHHHRREKRDLSTEVDQMKGVHHKYAYFSLEFENLTFILDLTLKETLLAESFALTTYTESGERFLYKPSISEINHCYYHGHVRGINETKVVASTCHGLNLETSVLNRPRTSGKCLAAIGSKLKRSSVLTRLEINGRNLIYFVKTVIAFPNDALIVEPLKNGKHIIYRLKDVELNKTDKICAQNTASPTAQQSDNKVNKDNRFKLLKQTGPTDNYLPTDKMFVEVSVVASYEMLEKCSSVKEVANFVVETVNFVDFLYQALNISVILSHLEIWNKGNKIEISSKSDVDQFEYSIKDSAAHLWSEVTYTLYRDCAKVLRNLAEYVSDQKHNSSSLTSADAIHFIYGGRFKSGVTGNAYVETICRKYALGFSRYSVDALNTASTFAHELGHNFGMDHDASNCTCAAKECVMAHTTHFSHPLAWSSCSIKALKRSFELGLGDCLYNAPKPSEIIGGPRCGDKIVEEGEECDCGFPEYCKSKCCNSSTCQFRPGAVCDDGSQCCRDCQIVGFGVKCRDIANECDLPEYCTGLSANCPRSVHKEDGIGCLNNEASCFNGVCLTSDVLCKNIWGNAARSLDICFEEANVMGEDSGHCGRLQNGDYIPCSLENVKCGKLQCVGGTTHPIGGDAVMIFTLAVNEADCMSYIEKKNSFDDEELVLVRNGTSCGRGKVCNARKCEDIPPLTCTAKCNGKGICDNLGNCHCDAGWISPYCNVTKNESSVENLTSFATTGHTTINCSLKCNGKGVCDRFNDCECETGWAPPYCDQPDIDIIEAKSVSDPPIHTKLPVLGIVGLVILVLVGAFFAFKLGCRNYRKSPKIP